MGRRLDGIHEAVSTTMNYGFLWWIMSPACCAPSFFQLPSCANHLSILGGARNKWAPWAVSWTAREPGCSYSTSHFLPLEEIADWGGFSWHWSELPWGRGDRVKWNYSFYLTLQCTYFLIFHFSGVLERLCWTPELLQKYFHLWVVIKVNILWGNHGRKLLFSHLVDVTWSFAHLKNEVVWVFVVVEL